jgi:hypothetical protein
MNPDEVIDVQLEGIFGDTPLFESSVIKLLEEVLSSVGKNLSPSLYPIASRWIQGI